MQFLNNLFLLLSVLLFSSFGHAANQVKVKVFGAESCSGTALSTLTLNADACVPKAGGFESFKVASASIVNANAYCFVYTYTDTGCNNIISGTSSAGPLYNSTSYPTGCVTENNGGSTIVASNLKLDCNFTAV